jgi:hypothetical protein
VSEALRQRGLAEVSLATTPGTPEGARALLSEFLGPGADRHALTRQLRPMAADYASVFAGPMADAARAMYEPLWNGSFSIGPEPGQVGVRLSRATTEELQSWSAGVSLQFPGGYRDLAGHLRPGLTIYEFSFVAPGEQYGASWDGLVFVNGHWVLFPRAWQLLTAR